MTTRQLPLVRGFLLLFSFFAAACLLAGANGTAKHVFDLPADSVENSVKKLSRQSGVDILVSSKVVRGVRTKPVKGEYTAREALEIMLAGTDLVVEQDEKTGALTVRRKEGARMAAPTGGIEGAVYNSSNGLPVARAKVSVGSLSMEMLTDEQGVFFFPEISDGEYQVEVSYLGFNPQRVTVTVADGKIFTQDFQIKREGVAPARRSTGTEGEEVVELEKFTVVADQVMSAQAIAMNEQRHAASISNVVAFDELAGEGFENIGDYVRFLPGVSIIDDGESPGQLSLGGFPANMSSVQLDGGDVASTGIDDVSRAGGRELSLQDVPMMNIERVEVTKVPTPDRPASGLGGSMNLVSKGLLGIRKPRINWRLTMNLATNDDLSLSGESKAASIPQLSSARKQPSFSLDAILPTKSKNLSFSAGFSKTWKQRPDDTPTETALWNLTPNRTDSSGNPIPVSLAYATWQQTSQITSTEDLQLGAEWRIARRATLTVNYRHREVSSEHTNNRVDFRYAATNSYNSNVPPGADPATTTSTNDQLIGNFTMGLNSPFSYNLETTTDQVSLRYKHRGSVWSIDAQASYSHAKRLRTNRDRGYVSGYAAGSSISNANRYYMTGYGINTTDSILPTKTVAIDSDGNEVSPYDGGEYFLNLIRLEEYGRYITDKYQGRFDAERIVSRHFSFKTGGAFSREERDNMRLVPTWRFTGDTAAGFTDDPRFVYHYDLIDESIETKVGGVPVRWISPAKVWKLTQERPEFFQQYSSSPDEHWSNLASNSKRMIEDVAAGYLRMDIRLFNNRLHAVVGARYERTTLDGWSGRTDPNAIYLRDEDGNRLPDTVNGGYLTHPEDEWGWRRYQERANHQSKSYDGIYPSVNINYAITPNFVARAAYARTIGRPNVSDVLVGATIPDVQEDATSYRIRISNPGLEPWTADSFHLSFDSYHLKGGFGSIGVYKKSVANFFADAVLPATEADLRAAGISEGDIAAMMETGNVELIRKENIGDADITGVEFSYRQDLFFLPSWLQKIQLWVNYTHLKVSGPNEEDFIGFTPDTFSAGINYIRPRFSLRVSAAYQGETKVRRVTRTTSSSNTALLVPYGTFEYQSPITRWSATAEYSFTRAFSVFANCSDIFGNDIIIKRRGPGTPSYAEKYQRRVVPTYISIGVKGTF